MTICCIDCRFFERNPELDESGKSSFGQCHRFPPAVTTRIARHGDNFTVFEEASSFPEVCLDEWCGEFKPKQ